MFSPQALNSLNDLRSFLRSRLDVTHSVVTMPVAPLCIALNTLPHETKTRLSCSFQTLVLRSDQVPSFRKAYTTLLHKSFDLYRCTTEIENIVSVSISSIFDSCINVVKFVDDADWFSLNPWHAPLQTLAMSALSGMPCLYPKKTNSSHGTDRSVGPRSNTCAIIGNAMVMPANKYTFTRLKHVARGVSFTVDDVTFISNALAAQVNYDKSVSWTCYIVCSFLDLLYKSKMLNLCKEEGCTNPIIVWEKQEDKNVNKLLDRITSFLTFLSFKLGPGNFATVFPVFPCFLVGFAQENNDAHLDLHRMVLKNPFIQFCKSDYKEELRPSVKKFNSGLASIFDKSKLCFPLDDDEGDTFSFIKALPLMKQCDSLILPAAVKKWLARVNGVLKSNHPPFQGLSCICFSSKN